MTNYDIVKESEEQLYVRDIDGNGHYSGWGEPHTQRDYLNQLRQESERQIRKADCGIELFLG